MNNIDPKSKPRIDHETLRLNKKPYPQPTCAQLNVQYEIKEALSSCPHLDHETAHLKAKGKLPNHM